MDTTTTIKSVIITGGRNHLGAPCPHCHGLLLDRSPGGVPGDVECDSCGWTGTWVRTAPAKDGSRYHVAQFDELPQKTYYVTAQLGSTTLHYDLAVEDWEEEFYQPLLFRSHKKAKAFAEQEAKTFSGHVVMQVEQVEDEDEED